MPRIVRRGSLNVFKKPYSKPIHNRVPIVPKVPVLCNERIKIQSETNSQPEDLNDAYCRRRGTPRGCPLCKERIKIQSESKSQPWVKSRCSRSSATGG